MSWSEKKSVRTKSRCWYGDFKSTPHPAFSSDTGQRAGSQLSVPACRREEAARGSACDVLVHNICHCAPSQFLSSSRSLTRANLLLFPLPSFHFPLLHIDPDLSSHQPSAAVRGYHSSKAAAVSGSSWTTGSSGGGGGSGQGAWSGPSFTHASLQHYLSHQQHPHHHHQSTHTSYAYCPAHTAVSTAHFISVSLLNNVSLSAGLFVALISKNSSVLAVLLLICNHCLSGIH